MRHPSFALIACLLSGVAGWAGGPARADDAAAQAEPAARQAPKAGNVVRVHDMRDLLMDDVSFSDAPLYSLDTLADRSSRSSPEGCSFPFDDSESSNAAAVAEEWMARIKECAGAPEDWKNAATRMSLLHGSLTVTAPESVQKQVQEFLQACRGSKFLSIALQTRVLRMPVAEFEKLADQTGGMLELDAAGVRALMVRAAEKDSGIQVLATARQRCVSGQRTYTVDGVQKAYVAEVVGQQTAAAVHTTEETETKETKDGKETKGTKTTDNPKESGDIRTTRPITTALQHGLITDTQAAASGDRRQVAVTLRSSFAWVSAMRPLPAVNGVSAEAPALALLQWRTTTTIPNGGAVLLSAGSPAGGGENAMETVLLLQATVVEPQAK